MQSVMLVPDATGQQLCTPALQDDDKRVRLTSDMLAGAHLTCEDCFLAHILSGSPEAVLRAIRAAEFLGLPESALARLGRNASATIDDLGPSSVRTEAFVSTFAWLDVHVRASLPFTPHVWPLLLIAIVAHPHASARIRMLFCGWPGSTTKSAKSAKCTGLSQSTPARRASTAKFRNVRAAAGDPGGQRDSAS